MDSPHPLREAYSAALSNSERASKERPSISIRTRLALGFLSLFLLSAALTIAAWFMLSRLEVRLRFLELADRYTMEIQQARRFEKNYFLYGANLQDVQEHVANARQLLLSGETEATRILTAEEFQRMQEHVDRYADLIERLAAMGNNLSPALAGERNEIEAALRSHGSQMVSFALDLAQEERNSVNQTFTLFKRLRCCSWSFC